MSASREAVPPASVPKIEDAQDFSLVLGGPLYQLYLRTHLAREQLRWLPRRVLLIPAIVWIPLFVLSWLDGTAIGNAFTIPFLLDIAVQAKYLLALPLLIGAESIVHRAIGPVVRQFEEREIVRDDDVSRFRRIVA